MSTDESNAAIALSIFIVSFSINLRMGGSRSKSAIIVWFSSLFLLLVIHFSFPGVFSYPSPKKARKEIEQKD